MKQVGTGVIVKDGKVLICQRPEGKSLPNFWEFPGGKIEEGETIQECLEREIWEELGVHSEVKDFIMTSTYEYEHGAFTLNVFFVEIPENAELQINVHKQIKWVDVCELDNYEYPPADLPIIEKLKTYKL